MKLGLLILVGWGKMGFRQWYLLEPARTGSYEPIVKFSGIWRTSWHHVASLKSAMVEMFTLQKSANATNQSSSLPSSWLLSISLHTTGFSYLKMCYISSPWVYFFPLAFFSYTYFPLMLSILWQKLKKEKKRLQWDVCPWTKIAFYYILVKTLRARNCCSYLGYLRPYNGHSG